MKILQVLVITLALALPLTGMTAETVDINSADAQTIAAALSGVGLEKAKAIVEYRQEHGLFLSVDDLVAVRGIGPKTLEKNRELITAGQK